MKKLVAESLYEVLRPGDYYYDNEYFDDDKEYIPGRRHAGEPGPYPYGKKVIVINDRGERVAIEKEDLERLEKGKDVVGNSLKYGGQEEWIIAKSDWKLEESVNEDGFEVRSRDDYRTLIHDIKLDLDDLEEKWETMSGNDKMMLIDSIIANVRDLDDMGVSQAIDKGEKVRDPDSHM
jgi:hypothetical protein